MSNKKSFLLSLSLLSIVILSACGKSDVIESQVIPDEDNIVIEKNVENTIDNNIKLGSKNVLSVSDIRKKYASVNNNVSPLYNVDQKAKFTFHFRSKVDPFQAVTVHTDRNCDTNSLVFTQNMAYFMPDGGLDVIVSNDLYKISVLNSDERLDYNENETTWGHASQYYLSINYDMESESPKKLDEPIIIPFTVKNDVQTPQVSYKISNVGEFSITWNDITDADSYRVYSAFKNTDLQGDFLNREHGYTGLHLHLVEEVSKGVNEYKIKDMASTISVLPNGKDEVLTQNIIDANSDYFVTAVKDGKESNFGLEVNTYKYRNQLPYELNREMTFGKSVGSVYMLPDTAYVKMVDGNTVGFPINYTLMDDTYVNSTGEVTYFYEVIGTKLTGKVDLIVDNGVYEKEIISSIPVNSGIYETKLDLGALADSDFPVINNGETVETDLTKIKNYNPNSRVVYNQEALNKRLDIEMARFLNDGVYNSNPNDILVVDYSDRQNDLVEREKQLGDIFAVSQSVSSVPSESHESNVNPNTNTNTNPSVNSGIGNSISITGENVIEEKIKSDDEKIESGNNAEVDTISEYYIKADTAEEAYLAYNLIAQNPEIRIDIFPSLLDGEVLTDVYEKVYFQNPYYLGDNGAVVKALDNGEIYLVPDYRYTTEEATQMQLEIYNKAENVIRQTIKDDMSVEDKVNAIWNYLENNSEYDNAALENAESHNFKFTDDSFSSSFNTYGILCKGVGVCQSYAYTMDLLLNMADVPCISLTGYASKTLPHAWNGVNINDKWYWIDATNNYNTSGIPYYLYTSSSDFAISNNYVLDDSFELNNRINEVYNSDISKDWYVENGLVVTNDTELKKAILDYWNKSDKVSYAVRLDYSTVLTQELINEVCMELNNSGVSVEDLEKILMGQADNYMIIIKDRDKFTDKFIK